MPRVDGYQLLPAEIRAWFDQALRSRGFGDYENLTAELGERLAAAGWGEQPSLATVGRWGLARKRAMESTLRVAELLAAIHDAAPDQAAKRTAGLSTLIQDRIVSLLFDIAEREAAGESDPDAQLELGQLYAKLGSTVAQMMRAEIQQRKWQGEVEAIALAGAADRVERAAQARGLSAEDAKFWVEQVLMGM
jgi:hypothetical protein